MLVSGSYCTIAIVLFIYVSYTNKICFYTLYHTEQIKYKLPNIDFDKITDKHELTMDPLREIFKERVLKIMEESIISKMI